MTSSCSPASAISLFFTFHAPPFQVSKERSKVHSTSSYNATPFTMVSSNNKSSSSSSRGSSVHQRDRQRKKPRILWKWGISVRSYIPSLLWRVCSVCCIWFENCACNCYNGKFSSVCKSSSRRKTSVPDCCASKKSKNIEKSEQFQCFSFTGEFSPNFDLKNMISTYPQDFAWKKYNTNSPDFQEFFFLSPYFFMISSSSVSFTGDFSPNFDLKKYDFHRIFHGKKWPTFARFWRISFQSPDFEELVFNRQLFMISSCS